MVGQRLDVRGAGHAPERPGSRPGGAPGLGYLQCPQRAVGATAGASRVRVGTPAGTPCRLPHDGTRATRQLALRQGLAIAPRPARTLNAASARPTMRLGPPAPG